MSIIITLPNRAPAILDATLAEQFSVETREINQARTRNPRRFPEDFAFQLTKHELEHVRSQIVTFKENQWFKEVFTYRPWAYTEEGVGQISGILNTPAAIDASVRIMRLFRDTRQDLYVTRAALQQLTAAVLAKNPTWRGIVRYKGMGLNHREIGKLLGLDRSTVRKQVRELEACGLLAPPRALPVQLSLPFAGGAA